MPVMIIVILTLLGLSLGSFVNALVWRLHEQAQSPRKRTASLKELSITKGRSMCPNCKHTLGVWDLLPIVSWLWLRGKCRYCHKPINWQYPLVELLTASLFVISFLFWPYEMDASGLLGFVLWLVALVIFMALIVYDLRWMLLPNRLVFPLTMLGAAGVIMQVILQSDLSIVVDAALSLAVAGGIFYVLFQVSDGKWIGGGDVKLGFAIGLLLARPDLSFLMLFVASFLGTLVAIPGMLTGKLSRTSRLPFGPFLIIATILVQLFGLNLIEWYTNLLGY
jgi:prepilin signal peptidase PulO-like enzyme (type II secretory pathway)